MAPASAGLGETVTSVIVGTLLSYVTFTVCVVVLPALSVAVITIAFEPTLRVMVSSKLPLCGVTVACVVPLTAMVTVTGELVVSFVVPITCTVELEVTVPVLGAVTLSVGATVSTVKVVDSESVLPSWSPTDARIV